MYDKREYKDFTTEELFSLIDEAASMGTRIINLGAGEPLMRKDIEKVIEHVRNKGIECRMNTNGHLIPQRISAVKKLNAVCISIDGDRKIHDSHKGEGSYDKVLAAIELCQANKIPVHTSTMLCRDNIHTVDSIMELAQEKGFFAEFLMPFFQSSDDLMASGDEYRAALKKIIEYKRKGYPVFFSERSHRYALDWPDYSKRSLKGDSAKELKGFIPCSAGKYMCIVDSDGRVYPCSQMIEGWDALNFRDHGFRKAWEHLAANDCRTCYAFICFNDYNLLLRFELDVMLNHVKNSLKEMTGLTGKKK